MNINRVNSGLIQQTGAASARVNLTISDRGVAVDNNATSRQVARPALQITSNEALQNVLSNEETQALMEQFGNSNSSTRLNFYNGRGDQIAATAGSARGGLVDLVG